jgi:glycosyltransferase involved in cell wall biosynthesis
VFPVRSRNIAFPHSTVNSPPVQRRILLLITDLEIGGTPTVVRELAIRLRDLPGVHVEVAGLSKAGPLYDQLSAAGIKCTALGARGTWDLSIIHKLLRLLRDERIDTVFSFLIHANALAALVCLVYRKARYFQSIQTTQPQPTWHWALQRIVQHATKRIAVPSASVATVARRRSGIADAKIVIIANAIELAEFRSGMGVSPMISNHERDARATSNIGFIGRLDPIKRIPDLLQALALLPPQIRLDIFGEGRERPQIEAEIARLHLNDRVKLHGVIARPQEALAKIDLLVLPSDAEGFGLVLIEAMAANIPVVATNVAGIRDVIIDGQTGLLVRPRSPRQLAAAISRLIDDSALRAKLVQSAAADVRRRFTWEVVLPQYLRLLNV